MRRPEEDAGFAEFVRARSDRLLRSAWLLTGDARRAEDLLQTALAKAWSRWSTIERADSPEAYVRRIIFTTYASWWRRAWRAEIPTESLPVTAGGVDPADIAATRAVVLQALSLLSRQSRAIVVLRYVEDRPVAEVADLLGISEGTVKVQASRALAKLREDPRLGLTMVEGAWS
ncbi:SigE family RNA polymerase sigma factor [Hamadaea tsunoensis]|uniref:SigE family RNA polymerase sigma factor n=1 Tax=Hamadaea tsunoensis TaxID=53368 RepID=UPI000426F6CA|nr:SigE family RNA polymerase sigma factor [Hamadaea tsunoensis]